MLGAQEHAIEIDAHLAPPIGEGEIGDRSGNRNPGIVDQNIQPAEPRTDFRDHGNPVGFVRHVVRQKNRLAAVADDPGHGGFTQRCVNIAERDGRALLRQPSGTGQPDPACPARHQGHFSIQFRQGLLQKLHGGRAVDEPRPQVSGHHCAGILLSGKCCYGTGRWGL